MSDTESGTIERPAPQTRKPRRRAAYKPRQRAARPAAASTTPDEFAGLTAVSCCTACNAQKCVISGIGICAHPFKGGLQAPLMARPDVVARFERAKAALGETKVKP